MYSYLEVGFLITNTMAGGVLNLFKVFLALTSFVSVFYVILEFTYFLSYLKPALQPKRESGSWVDCSRALLWDMVLLSLFVIQHSAMASDTFRKVVTRLKLSDVERSIYVTGTASVLWILITYWQTATQFVLWDLNFSYKPLFYLYVGIHATAWTIIYVANICTDVTELLGLKQVYYSVMNLPSPNSRKSYQLQKLNSHMRHPSFLGFLLVFWFYPLMTLDRLLLASILTTYMYLAWNTDGEDYNYQKYMIERKQHELQRMRAH